MSSLNALEKKGEDCLIGLKSKTQLYAVCKRQIQAQTDWKWKDEKKTYYANNSNKRAGVFVLISNKYTLRWEILLETKSNIVKR